MNRFKLTFLLAVAATALASSPAFAQDTASQLADLKIMADTLWVLVTAFLVFFMNTGFGCVEAGFCRAKNATNILGKNFIVFAISTLAFWAIGWGLMFGAGNSYFGTQGWFLVGADNSPQTASLASLVAADLKEAPYNIDLGDEKYAELNDKVSEQSDEATATVTKADESFTVKLELPGGSVFEKTYPAADFYWGAYPSISWTGVPLLAKFFFQLVFAGTAATIVSGCVAERIHYGSFMVFAVFIAAVSYPITGHWIWGGGWLGSDWGFFDFAGSTVVHSVGGWAGLAGILVLGPRLGKYRADGSVQPIPGHSMALAFLGGMILWLGWFGFNPGSTMAAAPADISHIVITTNFACAAGMISATLLAWVLLGKPDFSMTVNGALAGLVAITAPCAFVNMTSAVIIGLVGGLLVVPAVLFFDKLKIDDPVGALSVHLVNGIWGTLAVGLFAVGTEAGIYAAGPAAGLFFGGGATQLVAQVVGVLSVAVFTFVGSYVVWQLINAVVGIRVTQKEEVHGLDVGEMGMEAYNGFQVTDPLEHLVTYAEPRPAKIPPGGERFSVIISGVENGELMHAWSEMCKPSSSPPPEFKTVYPYMTTVQSNKFQFRGGDPEQIRSCLQTLFQGRLKSQIQAHVEK